MLKRLFIILILLTLSLVPLYAQREDPGFDPLPFERIGQSGWQFLHLPTIARNAALADIKCGLQDNTASAIFSNPANLVDVQNIDVTFSKLNYVAGISYMTAALAKKIGRLGVFGVYFASLDVGDMIRTENVYDPRFDNTYRSGDIETFTAGDLLAGLSYARAITDRLSIGANVGYIQETLDDTKIENYTVDFAIFFKTGLRSLTLSMVARNFGPDKQFTGFSEIYGLPQSVRMPLDFRLGVSYDILEGTGDSDHRLSAYFEGVHPNDAPERIHSALEYSFLKIFFLRGGYKFNYDEQGLTIGGGIHFNMKKVTGRIDYAHLDYGRLSSCHLFTLGFRFD
jgi:hypothetical protein